MQTGIKGFAETQVCAENTALALGSGSVEVFATPAMIALMEKAAAESVAPYLGEGCATVGTRLCVSHDRASPVGARIRCESVLTETDDRRLSFSLEVYDELGRIGGGTHERFIVDAEKFLSKAMAKRAAIK